MKYFLFTGVVLHKKWKHIRDNFTRDLQLRKGKSGDGASRKAPYMYAQQLEFLRDTVEPKQTTNSLQPPDEEQLNDDGPSTSTISTPVQTGIGKKRLHPVEERIIHSLDRIDKRANTQPDDDNRHFLLSLLPTLASLPKRMNSNCRLAVMQVLNKYEGYALQENQHSTSLFPIQHGPAYLPHQHQYERPHHSYQPQQSTQQYTFSKQPQLQQQRVQQSQQMEEYNNSPQQERQYAATSPADTIASIISNYNSEESNY